MVSQLLADPVLTAVAYTECVSLITQHLLMPCSSCIQAIKKEAGGSVIAPIIDDCARTTTEPVLTVFACC